MGKKKRSNRERLIGKKDTGGIVRYEVPGEDMTLLLVPPAEGFLLALSKSHLEGTLDEHTMENKMLIHCVHDPVLKGGEIVCDDFGNPIPEATTFETADLEWLCGETHKVGGWLRRLKKAMTTHVKALQTAGIAEGNATGEKEAENQEPLSNPSKTEN